MEGLTRVSAAKLASIMTAASSIAGGRLGFGFAVAAGGEAREWVAGGAFQILGGGHLWSIHRRPDK
jgi:hypothetical protein